MRAVDSLSKAGVRIDMLVSRADDRGERYSPGDLEPPPRFVARTAGAAGGSLTSDDGERTTWAAPPLPGPAIDAYGAGDSFAAGVTFGLARRLSPAEAAALGARCGAAAVTGRGPYAGQCARHRQDE